MAMPEDFSPAAAEKRVEQEKSRYVRVMEKNMVREIRPAAGICISAGVVCDLPSFPYEEYEYVAQITCKRACFVTRSGLLCDGRLVAELLDKRFSSLGSVVS